MADFAQEPPRHRPHSQAAPERDPPATVSLFGYRFCTADPRALLLRIAAEPRARTVVTANIDHIVSLSEDAAFRGAYDRAAARTLDGMPLVWLARARHRKPVARVTGHDLLACVVAEPSTFARRIYLVCATEAVAQALTQRLAERGFPREAVAYTVPPFGFDDDPRYGATLAERIRAHGTDLMLMGVGAPRSEVWVDRHAVMIGAPLVLCVGDALAVAAGLIPRAPRLLQQAGLEWAFRLALAPRRLYRRYLIRSWRFARIAVRELRKSRLP